MAELFPRGMYEMILTDKNGDEVPIKVRYAQAPETVVNGHVVTVNLKLEAVEVFIDGRWMPAAEAIEYLESNDG